MKNTLVPLLQGRKNMAGPETTFVVRNNLKQKSRSRSGLVLMPLLLQSTAIQK